MSDQQLAHARSALSQAVERINALTAARSAALEGEDYADRVGRIDREIVDLQSSLGAHQDKIASIEAKARKAEEAAREQRRIDAIAKVKKLLPKRASAAERLDRAVAELQAAYKALAYADAAVFLMWPDELGNAQPLRYLSIMHVESLAATRKQRMTAGLVRELAGRDPDGFAAKADALNAELIAELDGTPASEAA
jgi:hypothetical protein